MNRMAVGEIIGVITNSWISNDFCFLFCVHFGGLVGLIFKFAIRNMYFVTKKENGIQTKIRLETERICSKGENVKSNFKMLGT